MDILSDASKAWRALAVSPEASDEITILSPFITGPVLKELVQQSTASKFTIITSLTAKSLHSGSIDLDVLEELLELGADLRTYQPLHAKLMLRGNIMVMGSQNFTSGGMHNLEISIRTELGDQEHHRLKEIVNNALLKSSSIQGALLQSLAEKLSEIELEQVELDDHFQEITRIIEEATDEWMPDLETAKVNARALFSKDRADETHAVRMQYNEDKNSSWFERVGDKEAYGFGSWFPKSDLTEFKLPNGEALSLKRGNYYLWLDTDTLRPFYMKANQTQSTYLITGINHYKSTPQGLQKIEISLVDPSDNESSANVIFKIRDIEFDRVDEYGIRSKAFGSYHRAYLFDGSSLTLASEYMHYLSKDEDKNFDDFDAPEIEEHEVYGLIFGTFTYNKRVDGRPHHLYEDNYLPFELGVSELEVNTPKNAQTKYPFLCIRETLFFA